MKTIDGFRGDFFYLSNFSPYGFADKYGAWWQTVEHFFQAAKTPHPELRFEIWSARNSGTAKRIANEPHNANKLYNKKSWAKVNHQMLWKALAMKFTQNPDIREKLLSTIGYELIEGNTWHDNYWGDCRCPKCSKIYGLNVLGKQLMLIRKYKFVK
jgi:ribA/ribD-fused uncharacterized protein